MQMASRLSIAAAKFLSRKYPPPLLVWARPAPSALPARKAFLALLGRLVLLA